MPQVVLGQFRPFQMQEIKQSHPIGAPPSCSSPQTSNVLQVVLERLCYMWMHRRIISSRFCSSSPLCLQPQESNVLQVVLDWVSACPASRLGDLPELLGTVRAEELPRHLSLACSSEVRRGRGVV